MQVQSFPSGGHTALCPAGKSSPQTAASTRRASGSAHGGGWPSRSPRPARPCSGPRLHRTHGVTPRVPCLQVPPPRLALRGTQTGQNPREGPSPGTGAAHRWPKPFTLRPCPASLASPCPLPLPHTPSPPRSPRAHTPITLVTSVTTSRLLCHSRVMWDQLSARWLSSAQKPAPTRGHPRGKPSPSQHGPHSGPSPRPFRVRQLRDRHPRGPGQGTASHWQFGKPHGAPADTRREGATEHMPCAPQATEVCHWGLAPQSCPLV